jgi:D-sedoheptulose 7-phosphate isomerase
MNALLKKIAEGNRAALDGLFTDCGDTLIALGEECAALFKNGHKILFCGNGGSACDAMHIAGEFVGRFVDDRRALPAIALSADSGIISAIANDYSYDYVFARQVEALGQPGDMLIALSTSGQSPNVLKALTAAKSKGLRSALFTGEKGRGKPSDADITLIVPSLTTAHVQEAHITALHALARMIETHLFPKA